jgi:hypothetical protein
MGRNKIRELPPKILSFIIILTLLVMVFLFWVSYHYIRPFPPKSIVMATGMEGGAFAFYGERYKQILARDGIRVDLRFTSGAVENLRLLKNRAQGVEAGFVQGGVATTESASNLVSLGNLPIRPCGYFTGATKSLTICRSLREDRSPLDQRGAACRNSPAIC